jgi:hypothetical protein
MGKGQFSNGLSSFEAMESLSLTGMTHPAKRPDPCFKIFCLLCHKFHLPGAHKKSSSENEKDVDILVDKVLKRISG